MEKCRGMNGNEKKRRHIAVKKRAWRGGHGMAGMTFWNVEDREGIWGSGDIVTEKKVVKK